MKLGSIAGTPIKPIHLVAVAGTAGLATILFTRKGNAGPWVGWNGPPVEQPVVYAPHFPRTTAGHVAYTAYMIPLLMRHGLSHDAAVLFAAHVARETGYGSAVQNYNFGNIKTGQRNPEHPYYWLTDSTGSYDSYRSFDNPDDGIEENIRFIRDKNGGRYRDAWTMLLAGNPNWYGQLGLDGYYQGPSDPSRPGVATRHNLQTIVAPQNEYNGIVSLIQRYEQQAGGASSVVAKSPPAELSVPEALAVAAFMGFGAYILTGSR